MELISQKYLFSAFVANKLSTIKSIKSYKIEKYSVLSNEVLTLAEEQLRIKMEEEKAKNYEVISCNVQETKNSYIYTAKIRKTINIAKQENLKINDEILK